MTVGPFHGVYLGQCDLDIAYQFIYKNRTYEVASKYYGGLTAARLYRTPVVAVLRVGSSEVRQSDHRSDSKLAITIQWGYRVGLTSGAT
jgi:hypothetical protein